MRTFFGKLDNIPQANLLNMHRYVFTFLQKQDILSILLMAKIFCVRMRPPSNQAMQKRLNVPYQDSDRAMQKRRKFGYVFQKDLAPQLSEGQCCDHRHGRHGPACLCRRGHGRGELLPDPEHPPGHRQHRGQKRPAGREPPVPHHGFWGCVGGRPRPEH